MTRIAPDSTEWDDLRDLVSSVSRQTSQGRTCSMWLPDAALLLSGSRGRRRNAHVFLMQAHRLTPANSLNELLPAQTARLSTIGWCHPERSTAIPVSARRSMIAAWAWTSGLLPKADAREVGELVVMTARCFKLRTAAQVHVQVDDPDDDGRRERLERQRRRSPSKVIDDFFLALAPDFGDLDLNVD